MSSEKLKPTQQKHTNNMPTREIEQKKKEQCFLSQYHYSNKMNNNVIARNDERKLCVVCECAPVYQSISVCCSSWWSCCSLKFSRIYWHFGLFFFSFSNARHQYNSMRFVRSASDEIWSCVCAFYTFRSSSVMKLVTQYFHSTEFKLNF